MDGSVSAADGREHAMVRFPRRFLVLLEGPFATFFLVFGAFVLPWNCSSLVGTVGGGAGSGAPTSWSSGSPSARAANRWRGDDVAVLRNERNGELLGALSVFLVLWEGPFATFFMVGAFFLVDVRATLDDDAVAAPAVGDSDEDMIG